MKLQQGQIEAELQIHLRDNVQNPSNPVLFNINPPYGVKSVYYSYDDAERNPARGGGSVQQQIPDICLI